MDKILEELYRSKGFFPNPENCGCQMRTCYGLPCAHEIAISSIPLDSVDAFLRKLDLSPSVSVAYSDLNIDHRMERLKETFDSQPDHIKHQGEVVAIREMKRAAQWSIEQKAKLAEVAMDD
ncbi:hypothetical protein LXL04_029345 [Taraxacum kok-saghyz]